MELKENEKIQVEWLCHMKGIGIVICLGKVINLGSDTFGNPIFQKGLQN